MLNPVLIKMARYALSKRHEKVAVQPPEDPNQPPADPSQGGMPPGAPMDPSMGGGGMPPGGAPPMDPSMMGGGAGAPVPGAGGLTADSIRQIMQETLGQMGMVPGQSGPGGGAAGGKPGKPDLMAMSNDIFQIKKMLSTLFNAMGLDLPQDILDGPNRDPATGMPMAPGAPGSTSDPSRVSPPAGGGAGGAQQSAIKPIGPMQGAFPAGGDAGSGGAEKTSSIGEETDVLPSHRLDVRNKAAALSAVLRRNKMKN